MGYEQEMAVFREKIDNIDKQLVALFESRICIADEIARVKQRYSKPVFDAVRENEVISHAVAHLKDKANSDSARRFFRSLMNISRQRQHIATPSVTEENPACSIGYLGQCGSFSHIAACESFGANAELIGYNTFESMFEALREGGIGRAILPAENTETGSITKVVDLLAQYGYYIIAERLVKVSLSLLGINKTSIERLKTVCSHPEPIAQCSRFLSARPRLCALPALSTAQAASEVAEANDVSMGCIASPMAAKIYGLKVLAENIQNSENNSTRFVTVARKPSLTAGCDKTSIVFKLDHKPGSLYGLLRLFCDINILKLESRPLAGCPFEYLFHLDFEGSIESEHIARTLEKAKTHAAQLVWLGSYPRMTQA